MAFYTKAKRPPVLNIISLIDILCILLIFFIVTTEFKKDEVQLQIKLPETSKGTKEEAPQEPVTILISKEKKIYIGQTEVPLANLILTLKERKIATPQALYILKADTGVPLGFFIKVLDASESAGIANLSIMAEEAGKEK
jgi:biopolymer transport protein ExbD